MLTSVFSLSVSTMPCASLDVMFSPLYQTDVPSTQIMLSFSSIPFGVRPLFTTSRAPRGENVG